MGTARTGGHAEGAEAFIGEVNCTVRYTSDGLKSRCAEFLERMVDGGGPQVAFRIVRASDLRFSGSTPLARAGSSRRRTTSPAVASGGAYESVSLPLHGTGLAFGRRRRVREAFASALLQDGWKPCGSPDSCPGPHAQPDGRWSSPRRSGGLRRQQRQGRARRIPVAGTEAVGTHGCEGLRLIVPWEVAPVAITADALGCERVRVKPSLAAGLEAVLAYAGESVGPPVGVVHVAVFMITAGEARTTWETACGARSRRRTPPCDGDRSHHEGTAKPQPWSGPHRQIDSRTTTRAGGGSRPLVSSPSASRALSRPWASPSTLIVVREGMTCSP